MPWHWKYLTEYFLHSKVLYLFFGHCVYVQTTHRLQYYQSIQGSFVLHAYFLLPRSLLWGGILKIGFKRYHVIPYTPPDTSEKSIRIWTGGEARKYGFLPPLNEENTPKESERIIFVIAWYGINICGYWLFNSYIYVFIILIMTIRIG